MTAPVRPDREDHALAAAFAKDARDEDFLAHLNAALAPVEEALYREVGEPHPTLHVLGAPRSGTTLVTQLLATHLEVAPITNLAAAFWAAPVHGMRLSHKLLGRQTTSTLKSTYGRTDGIGEPHEFGYFWSRLLGYRELAEPADPSADPVDWERVRLVLSNLADAARAPVLFKAFMSGFYTAELQRVLPRTAFVLITREPVANALSILQMRREYSGGEEHWTGVRPLASRAVADAPPPVQAAAQVVHTVQAYRNAFARVGGRGCLEVSYEALCADPGAFVDDVATLLGTLGADVARTDHPLPPLTPSRTPRPGPDRDAIVAALSQLDDGQADVGPPAPGGSP